MKKTVKLLLVLALFLLGCNSKKEKIEILILGALQLVNEFGNNIEKAYINITQNYQNYII